MPPLWVFFTDTNPKGVQGTHPTLSQRMGKDGAPASSYSVLSGLADLRGLRYFQQLAAVHVINVTIYGNIRGHEWMLADPSHVVAHALGLVFDGEPLDEFTGA